MRSIALFASIVYLGCASSDMPSVQLHNAAEPGLRMPVVGLGTGGYGSATGGGEWWNDTIAEAAVKEWIKLGGRRIDTSLLYYTQQGVGRGWKASGVPRQELFITSKCDVPGMVHNGSGSGGMYPGGYNITINSVATTLKQLQTDYVDLMLIHWPGTPTPPKDPKPSCWSEPNNWSKCRRDTWRALVEVFKQGLVRAIGVSNFEVNHIKDMLVGSDLLPSVNQFEYHPYWQTPDLQKYCKENNIQMNGYSPLTTPDHMAFHKDKMPVTVIDNKVVIDIAKKYSRTPAQVVMRWELDNGFVLNPRTEKSEHMKENMNVFDFKLSMDDAKTIAGLENGQHVCGDPHLID